MEIILYTLLLLPVPASFDTTAGFHIYSYDGATRRDSIHYAKLFEIVTEEFNLHVDPFPVRLIFISKEMMRKLNETSPEEFYSQDWYGITIGWNTIFLYGDSDATVMHEYQHLLYKRGLLYQNRPPAMIESLVRQNELLLLGSPRYLEYLRTTIVK